MATDRYRSVLFIGIIIFFVQLIGSLWSGSAALLGDTYHVMHDVMQVLLAYLAEIIVQERGEKLGAKTRRRAGYAQCLGLVVIGAWLIYEGAERIAEPHHVASKIMLGFAAFGLIGNWMQHSRLHGVHSINARGLRLHILSDLVQSIGVALGALAMILWQCYWLDGLLSLLIGIVMLGWSFTFFKEVRRTGELSAHCGHDHSHNHTAHEHQDHVRHIRTHTDSPNKK